MLAIRLTGPEGASGAVGNSRQLSAGRDHHLRCRLTKTQKHQSLPRHAADNTRPGASASLNEVGLLTERQTCEPDVFVPRPFLASTG